MSLINDALKRTQDAQQQNLPPAGGPNFRPAEPKPENAGSGARTLLFIMVFAVVLGNFLLWIAFKDRNAEKAPVAANAPVQIEPAPAPQPAPAPVAVATPVAPEPAPSTVATAAEVAVAAPNVEEIAPVEVTTNAPEPAPTVVFAQPERPSVLRLQSIIWSSRPSAMISGKFLYVGDNIQGHRVIAINQETVTLVGDGQTNVLSLP